MFTLNTPHFYGIECADSRGKAFSQLFIFYTNLFFTHQSHKATGQARKQLVSKKIQSGKQNEKLPKEQRVGTLARDINVRLCIKEMDVCLSCCYICNPVRREIDFSTYSNIKRASAYASACKSHSRSERE